MNIETLRIFCDVVLHQSFSRGAAVNNVSQSAATQSVHRLETEFGVRLVDRAKRPFILTPEGEICYEGFREVLELYDSVETRVRSLRMEITGVVRVAAIYSVGLHDMSRRMQDFMRQYPKAKVQLEYLGPGKVYEAVANGDVDLGIVSYPAASAEIAVIPWRNENMALVCHPRSSARRSVQGYGPANPQSGFRGVRPRVDYSQGDRSLPAQAQGLDQRGDGVRQHRDHQAGGRDRQRDQHFCPSPRFKRKPKAARWRRFRWSRGSCAARSASSTASGRYSRRRRRNLSNS